MPDATLAAQPTRRRIVSIDALRGFVMLLMMVDHVRETFFMHAQVPDPMPVDTETWLFVSRLLAHICAPVFIALTGISAWLYGRKNGGAQAASAFLFKRGLFLVVLEVTVVSLAWTFDPTPDRYFLQVIWAIGLSMIALSALLWAPRPVLAAIGLIIVFGHNLLDPITVQPGDWAYIPWTILHERGLIGLPWGAEARTSYPLLPWIGVIALGYAAGPWFGPQTTETQRTRLLLATGVGALILFAVIRGLNGYGEPVPWQVGETGVRTALSLLNLTKYPPSLDFLLVTLGIGALLLVALERAPTAPTSLLAVFGGAPLFFYIVHLFLLGIAVRVCLALWGPNQGDYFSLPNMGWIWVAAMLCAALLWLPCKAFIALKARRPHPILSYL